MPNGEIEKLNYILKAFLIGETKSDIEKLNLLLDILFTTESEKQIYIDRYTKNSKLDIEEKKKFLIDIKNIYLKKKKKKIQLFHLNTIKKKKHLPKKCLIKGGKL